MNDTSERAVDNHVTGVEKVDVDALFPHPQNPNVGNVDAIADSIRLNGLYRPIVAQRSTSRVLAGHHTLLAMKELGQRFISVVWADVDDLKALEILLADNRTAELGQRDDQKLAEVLSYLETQNGLAASIYTGEDLAGLLDRLEVPPFEPSGEPPPRLDEKRRCTCPECGHEFTP